ncbi:hypothetical protein ACIQGZ_08425 [Streptomyces sp. NPDC092296]|uniref:hypothetical protein n=1 Tax=Streptomyces sp. NPDC092296 TaxID=3366012 RepID=UPI0038083B0B
MAAPTWEELWRALLSRPRPAVTGTYAVVRPRRDHGHGRPPGRVATTETFAFRPPGSWRCAYTDPLAHADGALWIATPEESGDDAPSGLDFAEDGFPWGFAESPERLVLTSGYGPLAAAVPLSEPEEAVHADRKGWAVTLDVPLAGPLDVVVDGTEGLLLRVGSPDGAYREELRDLAFPDRLPDSLFDPADLAGAQAAWEERRRAAEAAHRGRPLPVPGYWPGPRQQPSVLDGDLPSGLLVIDLGLDLGAGTRAHGPFDARLARSRPGDPPYLGGIFGDPGICVHTWTDHTWQWSLATDGPTLTPRELDAVITSMPAPHAD